VISHRKIARYLVVEEGKSGDEGVKSVKTRLDKVLGVVTEQLKDGKHGKTSVLKLLKSTLLFLTLEVGLSNVEVSEPSTDIDRSDGEDDLGPAESRDSVDGGNTVGDIGAGNSRSDVESPAEDLRGDVPDNGELGNTSVLQLGGTVLVELFLVNSISESQRIEESSGGNNSKLILVSVDGGGETALLGRGESGGGTGGGSEDGKLHHFGNRLSGVRFGL